MATYKCNRCGNIIVLPVKPGKCEVCGAKQFKLLGNPKTPEISSDANSGMSGISGSSQGNSASSGKSKTNHSKLAKSSPKISSNPQRFPKNPPPSDKNPQIKGKSSPKSPASPTSPKSSPSSTSIKSSFSSSSPNRPSTEGKKRPDSPSLPAYSASAKIKPLQKTARNSGKVPASPPPKPKFNIPWRWLGISLIIVISLLIFWQWQSQFSTKDFQKVFLNEDFSPPPKKWSLTSGALFKNGALFHQQLRPNSVGISIWQGSTFTDLDYSADVVKVDGPDNMPFGLLARINGPNNQNYYYLLIDGRGYYVLGKRSKNQWENKVGWKHTGILKTGKNARNRLRIVCKESLIIGYINGKRIGSFRDSAYPAGKIGVFSRRDKNKSLSVFFDNLVVKVRKNSSKDNTTVSLPQKAIQDYYDKSNQTEENKNFWEFVNQVNIYKMKTLSKSERNAKIQVWLKYTMKNGAIVCESRVITLQFQPDQNQWEIKNSGSVVQKPSCKL